MYIVLVKRTSSLNQLRQWNNEAHIYCFCTIGRSWNDSRSSLAALQSTTGQPNNEI